MDRVSPEKRSEVMSTVRAKNTRLEEQFARAMEEAGVGPFERYADDIVGRPDFAHRGSRVVVFVDSCYWHGCREHLRLPRSNREYWLGKVARNRRRDRIVTRELRAEGWRVLRVWEHSVKNPRALKWWMSRIRNLIGERESES